MTGDPNSEADGVQNVAEPMVLEVLATPEKTVVLEEAKIATLLDLATGSFSVGGNIGVCTTQW